jgi:hypothetical protein
MFGFALFSFTDMLKFTASNFFRVHFDSNNFHGFEISVKFCSF